MTLRGLAALTFAVLLAVSGYGQVSFGSLGPGGAYTQNFDGLTTTNVFVQDNFSFQGVYSFRTLGDSPPNQFTANNGSSNTGEFKNYGLAGDPDRCFGSLASNSTDSLFYGIRFQNDTSMTISTLDITYTGEQWRTASNVAEGLTFSYQVSAGDITDLTTGTYTNFPALDFVTPINTTPGSALNGNLPANRSTLTAIVTVSIPPGREIMLRWTDVNNASNDHGFCIDDVRVVGRATSTAADVSLSGRVRAADGRGLARTTVVLSGGSLTEPIFSLTNPFGYYRFDNVPSGDSYLLSVRSKNYRFETSTIFVNVGDEMTGLDFVAEP